jgi:hypothetical protein
MQPHSKSKLQGEAFKLYLLGGVAVVLAALWWLVPPPPSQPPRMGRLEHAFREELTSLFSAQAAAACQYWPKHLYMTCGNVTVSSVQLRERGWRPESSSENRHSYLREQWRLKLHCASLSKESCTPELWFVGSSAQ